MSPIRSFILFVQVSWGVLDGFDRGNYGTSDGASTLFQNAIRACGGAFNHPAQSTGQFRQLLRLEVPI